METVGQTLVLNASYEPINIVPDTRAVVLILQGKAESVMDSDRVCSSGNRGTALMFPSVIRLTRMADVPRIRQIPLSRKALFTRDSYRCQYCGIKVGAINDRGEVTRLEVEHILPRSRGGKNAWTNVTTACRPCNAHKRDRTPEEAGMRLLSKPYAPSKLAMIAAKGHEEWEAFIGTVET